MENRDDTFYMKRALYLAKKAEGYTSPNPLVGAVVVKEGEIIGEGYHKKAGGPHAEVFALEKAGKKAKNATLFVNLEPCCHIGKTSACSLKIINSKISTVVTAMKDPNPKVAGKGIEQLKKAGIEVKTGVMEKEAKKLNEIFIKNMTEHTPYIYLKSAQTMDGFLATGKGNSKWITNKKARKYGHKLRNKVDGILVGINTILNDNPRLTTRLKNKKGIDPVRILLDSKLKIPLDFKIINQESKSKTIIFTTENYDKHSYKKLIKKENVEIIVTKKNNDKINLSEVIDILYEKDIYSILIEGGGKVNHSFLHERLIDKIYSFIAPKLLGGNDGISIFSGKGIEKMDASYQLKNIEFKKLQDNLLIIGNVKYRG